MEFFEELYYTISDYMYENPGAWTIIIFLAVAFVIGAIGDRRYKKQRIMKLEAQFEEEFGSSNSNVKMIRKDEKKEKVKTGDDNEVWEL